MRMRSHLSAGNLGGCLGLELARRTRADCIGPEGRRPESLQLARSRLSTKRVGLGVGPAGAAGREELSR